MPLVYPPDHFRVFSQLVQEEKQVEYLYHEVALDTSRPSAARVLTRRGRVGFTPRKHVMAIFECACESRLGIAGDGYPSRAGSEAH